MHPLRALEAYLKMFAAEPTRVEAILRDRDVPGDLREQAAGNPFFAQYCPGLSGWLCRPAEMAGTDLTFAFEQG